MKDYSLYLKEYLKLKTKLILNPFMGMGKIHQREAIFERHSRTFLWSTPEDEQIAVEGSTSYWWCICLWKCRIWRRFSEEYFEQTMLRTEYSTNDLHSYLFLSLAVNSERGNEITLKKFV